MGKRKTSKHQKDSMNKISVGQSLKKKKFKKPDKRGRILVKNLPFKVTEADVKKYFSKYGQVSEVQLPRRDDGTIVGCGFVQFPKRMQAAKAVADTNGREFMGRTLEVSFALSKLSYIVACPNQVAVPSITGRQVSAEETAPVASVEKHEDTGLPEAQSGGRDVKQEPVHGDGSAEKTVGKIKKEKSLQKRGRLIVRNLPFKVTEEALKEHFAKFGQVHDVKLLRRSDGKLVGCGFVQFTWKQNAAKAILRTSGKQFMGRTIVVDWAVPKNTYTAQMQQAGETEVKSEPEDAVVEVKEEALDDVENVEFPQNKSIPNKHRDSSSDDSGPSDVGSNVDDEVGSMSSEAEFTKTHYQAEHMIVSNDVTEGCTVFVKNIPFSATSEQLRVYMEQFGDVVYALVCIDPLTEHTKGTGFVKFKSKLCAEKCLSARDELILRGQQLEVLPALPRQQILERARNNKAAARNRDSRNLYLVKEGVVMAGSHAASGVSAADMARRLQLEQWKSQMLRNLNMFVSRTRLVTHNLPPSWDDAKLRQLFVQHAPAGAFIKEARVMRDMRDVDLHGVARSKEYGFITFDSHEAALQALRSINNNPRIFTPAKRPIVSFSIENRAILNVKQRRLAKSLEKNPLSSGKEMKNKVERKSGAWETENQRHEEEEETERKWFAGVASRPGVVKMRSRFKLRTQAAVHKETLRQEKRRRKDEQRAVQFRQPSSTSTPQTQVKTKKRKLQSEEKEEEMFSKLIHKYKSKLSSVSKLKKWYD